MHLKVYQLGTHSNMEKKKKEPAKPSLWFQRLLSRMSKWFKKWVGSKKKIKDTLMAHGQGKNDKSSSQRTKSGKQWQRICTIDREPPAHIRH